ncbi:polysaccharide deacetylase family protein [Streptomyces sp. S.PNR 29]|nr:polysaccharide deacetylase family protein [Streptomyces sp. S.PNR 29]MDN0198175.1 polysaccharide deacetylase family protein [Streptomyces sp. S.PNR 29]
MNPSGPLDLGATHTPSTPVPTHTVSGDDDTDCKKVNPDIVRAAAKAGHEVGNHSWNHPDLTRLTPQQIASQINRTSAAIMAATGKAPTVFRPPYGAINRVVRSATTLSPVLWDMDTEDWKYRDPARVARTVISRTQRNDVVC